MPRCHRKRLFLASTRLFQRSIVLFDTQTGKVVREFRGHTSMIRQIEFSSDERWMASIDMDGELRLWDVQSSAVVTEPFHVIDCVESIRFHENDSLTVTVAGITRAIRLSGV